LEIEAGAKRRLADESGPLAIAQPGFVFDNRRNSMKCIQVKSFMLMGSGSGSVCGQL
jgi:hypothetical protein